MEELGASDLAVEVLAPGVAIGFVVAVIKTALPNLESRFYPALALAGGLLYAVGAALTSDLVVGDSPVAVLLMGVSVGAEASGLQGWLRSEHPVIGDSMISVTDSLAGVRLPGR